MPRLSLCLVPLLLLTLAFTFAPATAFAAAPSKKSSSALSRQIGAFDSLCANAQRAARRDLWLEQENRFKALEAAAKGDTAAKAAFYAARSRQELGKRSYLAADHRQAAALFGRVADAYGKNSLAGESLYKQASILNDLHDRPGAEKALKRLIRSYPKSAEAQKAKTLLASIQAGGSSASASAPSASQNRASSPQGKPAGQEAANAASRSASSAASSVTIRSIRWEGKAQKAVVILDLDAGTNYSHAFLPADAKAKLPARVYLDIGHALPGEAVQSGVRPKDLVVSRIRTGPSSGGTRVTLECDGLACYAVRNSAESPGSIEIELSRKQDIKGGIVVGSKAARSGGSGRTQGPSGQNADPRAGRASSVIEQLGLTVKTIMIDAGHGGKDPGAQHNGIVERRFTLAMAKRLGALLEKKGFTVLYTRTDNTYISLQDRPDKANNKKADLFISIHINANPKSSVRGLETYYLDEAKSDDAVTVAARENAVSVKNISDLQFILTDLMLGSKLKESHKLAECVHKGILQSLRKVKLPAHSNGVRSAPFYVLMGARMPAILVEFGYITNDGDAANLKNERFLQHQAEGLVNGIMQYKAEVAKMAP